MATKAKTKSKTPKTPRTTRTTRPARATRPQVISFRITKTQATLLKEIYERDAATGINSPNQLARKIICDYLAGRIAYKNPDDKLQDADLVGS